MPNLVEQITGTIRIDYGSFSIVDVDGLSRLPAALDPQELYSRTDEDETWFAATPNLAIVQSRAGSHHIARLTMELWDAEPPAEEEEGGVDRLTIEIFSSSGQLGATNSVGAGGPLLDLRVPEALWLVRGHRIARATSVAIFADAEDFDEDDEDEDGFEREMVGLEEFLFQFWPGAERSA